MEVVALVGPAGSGKSHRASLVAAQQGCDLIIDDGLLISESKILAGQSAKREGTRMGAVKRAIFNDPEHRAEVRAKVRELRPERVLVLGTSDDMVQRIVDALDLPRPERKVRIEEVASAAEIRMARRVRRQEGKHVIPAPTFEVKKTFSGYMIDPLRYLWKRQGHDALSVDKSVVRPTFSSLGHFFIADTVVAAIATHAAEGVDGISRAGRVAVEAGREGVSIRMELTLRFGARLWDVLREAQRRVKTDVEEMTAINVLEVTLEAKHLSLH